MCTFEDGFSTAPFGTADSLTQPLKQSPASHSATYGEVHSNAKVGKPTYYRYYDPKLKRDYYHCRVNNHTTWELPDQQLCLVLEPASYIPYSAAAGHGHGASDNVLVPSTVEDQTVSGSGKVGIAWALANKAVSQTSALTLRMSTPAGNEQIDCGSVGKAHVAMLDVSHAKEGVESGAQALVKQRNLMGTHGDGSKLHAQKSPVGAESNVGCDSDNAVKNSAPNNARNTALESLKIASGVGPSVQAEDIVVAVCTKQW
jgi:hypothetical protein